MSCGFLSTVYEAAPGLVPRDAVRAETRKSGEKLRYQTVLGGTTLRVAAIAALLCVPGSIQVSAASLSGSISALASAANSLTHATTGQAPSQGQSQAESAAPPATASEIPVYLPGGDEAGPTLPTQRGIGAIRSSEGLFQIAPYLGVNGIYDTGLAPFSTNESGQFLSRSAGGVEATFGVTGSRAYRHTLLNIAYRGGYSHYPRVPYLSNTNHRGTIQVNHEMSRRLQLNSQNSFGYLSNSFFSNYGFSGYDRPNDTTPINEFFNNPVLFLETSQMFTYQKSARTSFTGGGGATSHWRRSSALAGMRALNALGNYAYRLTRRQTIGATYSFNQFFFTNQYGGSNVHNVGLEYSAQLSRTVTATLSGGGSRVESQSLQTVKVDPLIEALFGTSGGIEAVYRRNYLPTFSGSISYARQRWGANASVSRAINPGNGIVLTNRNTTADAGIRYSARRWSARAGVAYSKMRGLKLDTGDFTSVGGNAGITIQVARGFSWVNDVSLRRFGGGDSLISNGFPSRSQVRVTTGIIWTPSEFPLPLF